MLVSSILLSLLTGTLAYEEAPGLDAFRRRALGAISVLDDYLYLEGGEISQLIPDEDGKLTTDPQFSRPSNVTLSVSLKESWSTDQVHFREIKRDNKHNVKDNAMWVDEKNGTLFAWDGQGSWGDQTSAKDIVLWMFVPDGSGGGKWIIKLPGDPDVYNMLTKMSSGAGATCGGQAFMLGGFVNMYSDAYVESKEGFPVPGMLQFDMETIDWRNQSLAPAAPAYGSLIKSRAVCVTGFSKSEKGKQTEKGGRNLLFSLGGKTTSPDQPTKGEAMNMGNITFYDVDEEKWYWQTTTGDEPDGRWKFCAAGVEGPDGTYEIFLYGGANNNDADLDDVWILTIPGFHWTKADVKSPKRHSHDCAIVGPGSWQMLSSGGVSEKGWYSDDEWAFGLGVLDLNEMKWNDGYEVSKEKTYKGPKVVRDWYQDGGMKQVQWDNSEVAAMFANAGPKVTGSSNDDDDDDKDSKSSDNSSGSGSSDSSNDSGNSTNKANEEETSSPPLGAIIGGAVGGVAALVLIGLLIFCLRRRKQNRNATSPLPSQNPDSPRAAPEIMTAAGGTHQDPSSPASTAGRTYTATSAHQAQKWDETSPISQTTVTPIGVYPRNYNPDAQELNGDPTQQPQEKGQDTMYAMYNSQAQQLAQQQQLQAHHYNQGDVSAQTYYHPQQQYPQQQHPFYAANGVVSPQSAGGNQQELYGSGMVAEMPTWKREPPVEMDGGWVPPRQ